MKSVLLTVTLPEENLKALRDSFPQCSFTMPGRPIPEALIGNAEIILGGIDRSILEKAVQLRWFHSVSAGIDSFIHDVDELAGGNMLVSNSAGVYGVPISEHLLALMLAFSHGIGPCVLNMPQEKWGNVPHCREIYGSTVGIVGYGDIGSHLADLLVPFKCEVLAFKRTPVEKPPNVSCMLYGDAGLDELMKRSDYISICLPGTAETTGLIDRRRIGLMKPSSALFNIGRGSIIDTDAFVEALAAGKIAGAGLDVTDPEPLPPGHPLWKFPNVIITPHISGYTKPHWHNRITDFFMRNLEAYVEGRPLPGAVDRIHKY